MKSKLSLVAILIVVTIVSCVYEIEISVIDEQLKEQISSYSKTGAIDYFIMPSSEAYGNIPNQDPNNPITAEKIELGQQLFF